MEFACLARLILPLPLDTWGQLRQSCKVVGRVGKEWEFAFCQLVGWEMFCYICRLFKVDDNER